MIEARNLLKRFHGIRPVLAVDRVSFRCEGGQVFGLLGPNGAGKTTTLRMLATLLAPDEGSAVLNGFDVKRDPAAVRASIGYLSTSTGLYDRLTAHEMILYFARLYGVERPEHRARQLEEELELTEFAGVRCQHLSTGNRQKVSIARALVHDPPILILDEPTSGLDVLVARSFMDLVERARAAGRCVLLSTHVMSEAQRLCDRIAVIHGGRILANDTLDGLRQRTGEHYLESVFVKLLEQSRGRGEDT